MNFQFCRNILIFSISILALTNGTRSISEIILGPSPEIVDMAELEQYAEPLSDCTESPNIYDSKLLREKVAYAMSTQLQVNLEDILTYDRAILVQDCGTLFVLSPTYFTSEYGRFHYIFIPKEDLVNALKSNDEIITISYIHF